VRHGGLGRDPRADAWRGGRAITSSAGRGVGQLLRLGDNAPALDGLLLRAAHRDAPVLGVEQLVLDLDGQRVTLVTEAGERRVDLCVVTPSQVDSVGVIARPTFAPAS
jgi:hypothetical protein